jgi:hypothetical protein
MWSAPGGPSEAKKSRFGKEIASKAFPQENLFEQDLGVPFLKEGPYIVSQTNAEAPDSSALGHRQSTEKPQECPWIGTASSPPAFLIGQM